MLCAARPGAPPLAGASAPRLDTSPPRAGPVPCGVYLASANARCSRLEHGEQVQLLRSQMDTHPGTGEVAPGAQRILRAAGTPCVSRTSLRRARGVEPPSHVHRPAQGQVCADEHPVPCTRGAQTVIALGRRPSAWVDCGGLIGASIHCPAHAGVGRLSPTATTVRPKHRLEWIKSVCTADWTACHPGCRTDRPGPDRSGYSCATRLLPWL